MNRDFFSRRKFIKSTTMGLGSLSVLPLTGKINDPGISDEKQNPINQILNIICVGAHPGDPEFGCGGTMARYRDAGHNVIFIYLTRGEGWAGDPSLSYEEAAALRTREAEASCKILNVKPVFAGQIDGETELNKKTSASLTKLILSFRPDIVFTQWPVDTHPDHQVTGSLSLTTWHETGQVFDLYFYEVDTGTETMGFTPTDYVDITDVHDRKMAAMMAHKTQSPEKIYEKDFIPMERFRGIEAGVKQAEAFVHFKRKASRSVIPGL